MYEAVMGCYYETCGLSRLPIPPGTKCLLFLLGPGGSYREGGAGFTYPSSAYTPLGLPVEGTYNDDTGTLDLAKKPPAHWNFTVKFLEEMRFQAREGDDYSEDPPFHPFPIAYSAEDFYYPVSRGLVRGAGWRKIVAKGNPYQVDQVLIRQDVWNNVLRMRWDAGFRKFSYAQCQLDVHEYVNHVIANPPKEMRDAFKLEMHFKKRGPSTFFRELFRGGEEGPGYSLYQWPLTEALMEGKIDRTTALTIFAEIAAVAHVNQMMYPLRLQWSPQSGKGSQDIEWDVHMKFHAMVGKIATASKKKDQED